MLPIRSSDASLCQCLDDVLKHVLGEQVDFDSNEVFLERE